MIYFGSYSFQILVPEAKSFIIRQKKNPWIFVRRTDVEAETPILWPPDAKR